MSMSDELRRLEEMHRNGTLSDDEYDTAKQKVLNEQPRAAGAAPKLVQNMQHAS